MILEVMRLAQDSSTLKLVKELIMNAPGLQPLHVNDSKKKNFVLLMEAATILKNPIMAEQQPHSKGS